jgi:hypothetical protein
METRKFEMSVKRKNAIYLFTLHQNKRYTIGKTDMLIRIFVEKLKCFDFILFAWLDARVLSSGGSMIVVRSIIFPPSVFAYA